MDILFLVGLFAALLLLFYVTREHDADTNPPLDQDWQKPTRRPPSRPAPQRPAPYDPGLGDRRTLRGRAWVIDGDTIAIDRIKIRLAGIDAPELDEPWGQKSRFAMMRLCKGQIVTAKLTGETSYDRVVGTCYLDDGRDLGAELIKEGLALDFAHFSGGKYRALESTACVANCSLFARKMSETRCWTSPPQPP